MATDPGDTDTNIIPDVPESRRADQVTHSDIQYQNGQDNERPDSTSIVIHSPGNINAMTPSHPHPHPQIHVQQPSSSSAMLPPRSATLANYKGVASNSNSRRHAHINSHTPDGLKFKRYGLGSSRALSERSGGTLSTVASTLIMKGDESWTVQSFVVLVLLALIWGSAFLAIKWGVQEIPPCTFVAIRLLFGGFTMGMTSIAFCSARPAHRISFKKRMSSKLIFKLCGIALFNYSLPFTLISYAMLTLSSSTVGILDSIVPIVTFFFSWGLFSGTRHVSYFLMSKFKVIGLVCGIIAVVCLCLEKVYISPFDWNIVTSCLLCIVAAISESGSAVFGRKYIRKAVPLQSTAISICLGGVISTLLALFIDIKGSSASQTQWSLSYLSDVSWFAWGSVIYLAVVSNCIAYILYISLLETVGEKKQMIYIYFIPSIALIEALFIGLEYKSSSFSWIVLVMRVLAMVFVGIGCWFIVHKSSNDQSLLQPLLSEKVNRSRMYFSRGERDNNHSHSQRIVSQ